MNTVEPAPMKVILGLAAIFHYPPGKQISRTNRYRRSAIGDRFVVFSFRGPPLSTVCPGRTPSCSPEQGEARNSAAYAATSKAAFTSFSV